MRRNRGQVMYMPRDGKVNEMPNPKTAEEIFAEKNARIAELETELAALKEKYRWRMRSEEPAPNDDTLIICLLKKGGRCSWQAVIQARFIKQFEEPENNIFFWRPLDLPEMGEAK